TTDARASGGPGEDGGGGGGSGGAGANSVGEAGENDQGSQAKAGGGGGAGGRIRMNVVRSVVADSADWTPNLIGCPTCCTSFDRLESR
ncbi:MAG: hypothetical protein AAF658_18475, partial [Myxococcota bacterium]